MQRRSITPRLLLRLLPLLAIAAAPAPDLPAPAAGADSSRSSNPSGFARIGRRAVFFARDSEAVGLWATDGTPAGTLRLTEEAPLAASVGKLGGSYLWFGKTTGVSLWRTAGTPASTFPLAVDRVVEPEPDDFPIPWAIQGGRLLFFRQLRSLQLWSSDGTTEGTRLAARLPQVEDPPQLASGALGGLFFFTAHRRPGFGHTGYDRWALWRSDGTAAGTRRLADLPDDVLAVHATSSHLLFLSGGRLWSSDGSVKGTRAVFGPPRDAPLEVHVVLGGAGDRLYFLGRPSGSPENLWVSDGTRRGTRILAPGLIPGSVAAAVLGDRIFFAASDGAHGSELWSSRGTAATTAMVADLCPGSCSALPGIDEVSIAAAGGRIFFLSETPAHGRKLFVSDGTATGTRSVLDLCAGACGFSAQLRPEGSEVFFYGRDPDHGVELWASDGTAAGSRRLTDFAAPEPFGSSFALPAPSVAVLGRQVVTVGFDPVSGLEPWAFERDGGGGLLLADIFGGDPGPDP